MVNQNLRALRIGFGGPVACRSTFSVTVTLPRERRVDLPSAESSEWRVEQDQRG
jgi:hypothetical protein